jgi:hypothetical protein
VQLPAPPNLAKTTQLVLGAVFLTIGLALIAAGAAQLALYPDGSTTQRAIGAGLCLAGLPFAIPGAIQLRRALRTRRVLLRGRPGEAQVLHLEPTRSEVEGHPVCVIRLRVMLPGEAPYEVAIRWIMGPYDGTRLVPGRIVPVKVDPSDRQTVVLA